MQIPCLMLSWIVIPSWWILSNHLDFSNCNFITKLPNPGSPKLPTINCFPMRELWLRKLFHWQFVFTNQKQPNKARPKILSCCDEIMLRDKITGLDGTYVKSVRKDGFFDTPFKLIKEKKFSSHSRVSVYFLWTKKPKMEATTQYFGKWFFINRP